MQLTVKLLGGLAIELDGEVITEKLPIKSAILLAYLAQEQKVCSREVIATLFWENSSQKQALSNLRTILSHLRRHIKPFLTVTSKTLSLNENTPIWVDSVVFHNQITTLADRPLLEDAIPSWQQTLTIYQGPFLAGLSVANAPSFDKWVDTWRHHLHQLVVHSQQRLLTYYQQQGNDKASIQQAQALLQIEPTHEYAHHQLMLILTQQGNEAAALAHYEAYQTILAKESTVEPNPEIKALYERIRTHKQHTLRPLPQALTSFVGRQEELDRLIHQLQDPQYRLVSIIGLGGMGKTRLALQVAQQINAYFLDGIGFVPLAPIEDPAFIEEQIIDSLQIILSTDHDLRTQLLRYLQDKHLLLVLDNAEHLTEQDGRLVDLIQSTLRQAPQIKILVTSRVPLYLQAEQRLQLQGLDNYSNEPAIQLFTARAQMVQPNFRQSHDNRQDIQTICQLVGGMPLAIELAAGWVGLMSCAEIAVELTKNIDLLATPLQDVPPRQKSLQAVMQGAWQNLEVQTQQVLTRLSLFQGAFTLAAARIITKATPWQIRALVDKGLLQRVSNKRYLLPQAVQLFAQGKLEQLEPTIVNSDKERHGRYYLDLLIAASEEVIPFVRHEQGNIKMALSWAVQEQLWQPLKQAIEALTALYQTEKSLSHKTSFFQIAHQHLQQAQQDQHPIATALQTQLQFISQQLTQQSTQNIQKTLPARYQVHEPIGEGGMGIVYRVTDRLTRNILALKQITTKQLRFTSHPVNNPEVDLKLALAHEFQVMASLRHPHILSVLDYGFDEADNPFFTMPYLTQPQTFLEAGKHLDTNGKLTLLYQLVQALHYLHRRGIIHRDLKPSNILVVAGMVKVLDFGLSVSSEENEPVSGGTIHYLAPEVWQEQRYSLASDMYAVGILAFQLFAADNTSSIIHPFMPFDNTFLQRVLKGPPNWTLLACDNHIIYLISQLLQKKPQSRLNVTSTLHNLSKLLQQPPPETKAIRESYLQAATFVGRQKEQQQFTDLLAQAKMGQPQAVLIGGESGVGKSRLLNEIRIQALVNGFVVLQGQAIQEGGLPYQLWREPIRHLCLMTDLTPLAACVLQSLVPDLAELLGRAITPIQALDGHQAQQRLFSVITNLFLQQQRPILLLMEDLHWAQESLEVLTWFLQSLLSKASIKESYLPLLVIGSYRTEERPLLPEQFPQMTHIHLKRLTDQDVQTLCQNILGKTRVTSNLVTFLQQQSEGNTFFLVEIVRTLADQVGRLDNIVEMALPQNIFPAGIASIVQQRLALLPDWTKPLLNLAAIAGRQLDLPLMQHLASETVDLETDWLPAVAEVSLLSVEGVQWQFAHDKLREGLLNQLNPTTTQNLHYQVAQALEALYPHDPSRAVDLMHHWGGVGKVEKELQYAQQAGQYAQSQNAYQDALTYWHRAEQLLTDDKPIEQYNIYMAQEEIYARQGNRPAQHTKLTQLQTMKAKLTLVMQGQITLRQAEYARVISNYEQAKTYAQTAIILGQQSRETMIIMAGHQLLGAILGHIGQYISAQDHFAQSLQLAQELKTYPHIARSLRGLGAIAFHQGNTTAAHQHFEQALTIAQESGDILQISEALTNLGVTAKELGQEDIAQDYYQQALHICQEIGNRPGESGVLQNLGNLARKQGNHIIAQQHLIKALSLRHELGDQIGQAAILNLLGIIALEQGDHPTAQQQYQQALTIRQTIGDRLGEGSTLNYLGLVALEQGDKTLAQQYWEQALTIKQTIGDRRNEGATLHHLGDLFFTQNKIDLAENAYEQALAIHQALNQPHHIIEDQAGLAQVKQAQGNHPAAKDHINQILTYLKENPTLYGARKPIHTFHIIWQVLQAIGQPAQATHILSLAAHVMQDYLHKNPDPIQQEMYLRRPYHQVLWQAWKDSHPRTIKTAP